MREIEITTFTVLYEIVENYDTRTVIYRGMKSVRFPLIPGVGRIVPPKSIKMTLILLHFSPVRMR